MKINFAFFGTSDFSVVVLNELKKTGWLPTLIITAPDKPKGRGLKLTPLPVKLWALANKIDFIQPEKLDSNLCYKLQVTSYKIFVVASYGKIIPREILDIPEHGALNVHPSLLPKYRGASPIQAQILNDEKNIGVTIMLMDEKMDHGPVLANREFPPDFCLQKSRILDFDLSKSGQFPNNMELSKRLAKEGGELLAETLPKWLAGKIKPIPQDDGRATFCQKISKEDGLIDLNANSRQNFLKIQAFAGWPGTYFFVERKGKKTRVKITKASFTDGKLKIESVIPEGKKEISWKEFSRFLFNDDKTVAAIA
ncbi:MAG: methionyl-tRNA formyltransferase [Patescibacteria group bacterium]